jgi:hypothetical protein
MISDNVKLSRIPGLRKILIISTLVFLCYKVGDAIAKENVINLVLVAGVLVYGYCTLFKWEVTVFLFIVVFPTFQKIAAFEIAFMDLNKFLTVGLIASYLLNYRFTFERLPKEKRLALFLFIFWYLIYEQYRYLKGINFGYEVCDRLYFVQLIVWIVNCLAVYLVISKSDIPHVRNAIKYGLVIGTLVLVISVYFSDYFSGLGLTPEIEISQSYTDFGSHVIRYAGLYNGHATMFSALMAIMFGYFISVFKETNNAKNKLIYLIILVMVLSTFIFNPSRNGMVGIVCILIAFMLFERKRSVILLASIIVVFVIMVNMYGEVFLYRTSFDRVSTQLHESRLMLLKTYLDELVAKPEYLFYGTTAPLYVSTHNTYLEIIYHGGIPFFAAFSYLIYKIYYYRKVAQFNIMYPTLGFLVPFAGNNNPLELYYVLIITIAFSKISNEEENFRPLRFYPTWIDGRARPQCLAK